MLNDCCNSACVRTAELGPSTSGTGSFQNLTGLPQGTNVRKRKSCEVSIQQTIATTTQRSSKIAAKKAITGFVSPRKRVKMPKLVSTFDEVSLCNVFRHRRVLFDDCMSLFNKLHAKAVVYGGTKSVCYV